MFIWRGGQKTKRVAEVEERLRAALTDETPNPETEGAEKYSSSDRTPTPTAQPTNPAVEFKEEEKVVDEHMTVPALGEGEKSYPSS